MQIRSFCADHQAASYKHLQSIFLCNELPLNHSGMVVKHNFIGSLRQVSNNSCIAFHGSYYERGVSINRSSKN